jgi:hypothetical protein
MRFGTGKILGALAPVLALLGALAPAATADAGAVQTSIHSLRGQGATASATMTFLTIDDPRQVDNRINVFVAPSGRLTLVAPEGLADPDGPAGSSCTLDNAQPGQTTATQISCAPGWVQLIVGDLGGGNDTLTAAPDLTILIGSVLDGVRRPVSGGLGQDRIVGGTLGDLLDGGAGDDSLIGNQGEDLLTGGAAKDKLIGGGARDALFGGGGPDKLNGGPARDFCNGGPGIDLGLSCNILQSIP